MPVRYLIAAAGAAVLFAFAAGYHAGAKSVKTDMAERAAAQVEDARRQEKAARAAVGYYLTIERKNDVLSVRRAAR